MGRKLGATPRFGKAAVRPIIVVLRALRVHLAGHEIGPGLLREAVSGKQKARAHRPGLFQPSMPIDQAAGL
jgi:hypothetical protein